MKEKQVKIVESVKHMFDIISDNNVLTIDFKKDNGESRQIIGTTLKDYLPEEFVPKGDVKKVIDRLSMGLISVFDLENRGWRSIRFNNLSKIETKDIIYLKKEKD